MPDGQLTSNHAVFAHPDVPSVGYLVGRFDESYFTRDSVTMVTWSGGGTDVAYADRPALNGKRGDVDITVLDGYTYVSRGYTHENDYAMPKNSVEVINSLNQERGDKQLAGLNGRVYSIGGETQVDIAGVPESELPGLGTRSKVLDTVEVYARTCTSAWPSGAASPRCRNSYSDSACASGAWRGRRTGTSLSLVGRLCMSRIASASAPMTR